MPGAGGAPRSMKIPPSPPLTKGDLGGFEKAIFTPKEIIGEKSIKSFDKECGISDSILRQYLKGSNLPGRGLIDVTSDNPSYEPFQINRSTPTNETEIIGHVVWMGRRI